MGKQYEYKKIKHEMSGYQSIGKSSSILHRPARNRRSFYSGKEKHE
jgi:hypothetical protein